MPMENKLSGAWVKDYRLTLKSVQIALLNINNQHMFRTYVLKETMVTRERNYQVGVFGRHLTNNKLNIN